MTAVTKRANFVDSHCRTNRFAARRYDSVGMRSVCVFPISSAFLTARRRRASRIR